MLLVKANFSLFSYSVFLVLEIKTLKLTSYISAKAGFIWFITRYIKNIKLFREVFALDYLWPLSRIVWEMIQKNPNGFETVQKMVNAPEKSGQL